MDVKSQIKRDEAYIETYRRKDKKTNFYLVMLRSFDEPDRSYSVSFGDIIIKSVHINGHLIGGKAINMTGPLLLSLKPDKYNLEIHFEVNRSLVQRKVSEISKKRNHILENNISDLDLKYKGTKKITINVNKTDPCYVLLKATVTTRWLSRTDSVGYTYWLFKDYTHSYECCQTSLGVIKGLCSYWESGKVIYPYPPVDKNLLLDVESQQALDRAKAGNLAYAQRQATQSVSKPAYSAPSKSSAPSASKPSAPSAKPVFQKIKYSVGEYAGETVNGLRHGEGAFRWTNGDMYFGDWRNDKRTGNGTYYYKNGDKHVGAFVDGKRNGPGTYTFKDGRVKKGVWKDDKYIG